MQTGVEGGGGDSLAVSASARRKCWEARDAFFACRNAGAAAAAAQVDADGKVKVPATAPGCEEAYAAFAALCPRAWRAHFLVQHSQAAALIPPPT